MLKVAHLVDNVQQQTLVAVIVGALLILIPALQALTLAYFHMKQTELSVRTADLAVRADNQSKTMDANKIEAIAARTAFEDRVVSTITNGTMAALKDTALQAASSATVPANITVPPAQVIIVTAPATAPATGTETATAHTTKTETITEPTTAHTTTTVTEVAPLANIPTKDMGMIDSNPNKGGG